MVLSIEERCSTKTSGNCKSANPQRHHRATHSNCVTNDKGVFVDANVSGVASLLTS
jgi:hypothetical protein